jgi:transposase
MGNSKNRRKWTPKQKLEIVLESLQSDTRLAEICRREGLAPNMVYKWRQQLMGSAEAVFARKKPDREDPRIDKMDRETRRMKDVIAEITAENLVLKKTLSD